MSDENDVAVAPDSMEPEETGDQDMRGTDVRDEVQFAVPNQGERPDPAPPRPKGQPKARAGWKSKAGPDEVGQAAVKAAATAKVKGKPKAGKRMTAATEKSLRKAADVLKQASDYTRLRVIVTLADSAGGINVTSMCGIFGMSQPALSHHLALLRHSRLVEPKRTGKNNVYSLTDDGRQLAEALRGLIA